MYQLVPTEIAYKYYVVVASDTNVMADDIQSEVLPSLERNMLVLMQSGCSGAGRGGRRTEQKGRGGNTVEQSNRQLQQANNSDAVIAIQSGPSDQVDVNGKVSYLF